MKNAKSNTAKSGPELLSHFAGTEIKFRVLTFDAEKIKWDNRFRKAYTGAMLAHNHLMLFGPQSKFILAEANENELGYVRLNNLSYRFNNYTDMECWNVGEGYVKPCFRKLGVFQRLLEHVTSEHSAASVLISSERYEKHRLYYAMLGYTLPRYIASIGHYRLYQTSWTEIVKEALSHAQVTEAMVTS
jgi:hypothetical protein